MTPKLFKRKLFRKVQQKMLGINKVSALDLDTLGQVLILAPHADDETIGAFTILERVRNVTVCVVTDCSTGEGEQVLDFDAVVTRRENEFKAAMSFFSVDNIVFNKAIPNDQTYLHPKSMQNLFRKLSVENFDTIFVPHQHDNHPDHRSLNLMLKKYLRSKKNSRVSLFGYEVWTPIQFPTNFVAFCADVERKKEAISCYGTQQASVDYAFGMLGLNAYRGIQNNVRYAECFIEEKI